jgi:DNA-binding NtrC family response regulator
VRVIAATNRNLLERIGSKDFREDLYYRLNVIHITIPPLRQRREDIPVFMQYFLRTYAERHRTVAPELSPDALAALVAYAWPGNVRELKNVAERLVIRRQGGLIVPVDLPPEMQRSAAQVRPATPPAAAAYTTADVLFDRMVTGGESFWDVVHGPFMARDLTRADLRAVLCKGLQQTGGSYKVLVELFNMPESDYKRLLNFLRKHDCQVPFQRFRTARASQLQSA